MDRSYRAVVIVVSTLKLHINEQDAQKTEEPDVKMAYNIIKLHSCNYAQVIRNNSLATSVITVNDEASRSKC